MMKFAQALRNLRDEESGFTLIELMVVIVIIGILAAVAIPQFANIINNSRVQSDVATGKTIKDAIDRYYTDNGAYPASTVSNPTISDVITALMSPPSGSAYLNAAPTTAQKKGSTATDITTVFKYDPSTGNVAVMNIYPSTAVCVWESGTVAGVTYTAQ